MKCGQQMNVEKESIEKLTEEERKGMKSLKRMNEDNKLKEDTATDQTILDNWDIARELHVDNN